MWTLLFDIDGTLLRTGGAGMIAIRKTFQQLYGHNEVQRVPVHGRTDFGIISEMFAQFDIDPQQNMQEFNEQYWRHLPEALHEIQGTVLPGVRDALSEIQTRDDVAIGLLTGNSEPAARIKLRHYGLEDYFSFGGFGQWHVDRNDVAELAFIAARQHVGNEFKHDQVWVIGDTVNDIRCARAIESKVLVVETGGVDPQELSSADPDLQIADMTLAELFFEQLAPPT